MEKERKITAPEGCEIEKLMLLYGIKEGGEEWTQYVITIDKVRLLAAETLPQAKAVAEKALQNGAAEALIEKHTSERVMVITRKEAEL